MGKRKYTEAQEDFIRNNYRELGDGELGDKIGRSATAVSKKLTALGLKRTAKQRRKIMKRLAGHTWFSDDNKPTQEVIKKRTKTRLDSGYKHHYKTKKKIGKGV